MRLTLFIIALHIYGFANAQAPQPIYSFAIERQTEEWYLDQMQAWKTAIKKDNKNAVAHYYYYRALRNYTRTATKDIRTEAQKNKDYEQVLLDMEQSVPNSFEYNYVQWMQGSNSLSKMKYLNKAIAIDPEREELTCDLINKGELERDSTLKNKYCKIWLNSRISSQGLLSYAYNALVGLNKNAILVTYGDNDTYPLWQLQAVGIRKDVTVLNINLLIVDEYRNKVFAELGLPIFNKQYNDAKEANENCVKEILNFMAKSIKQDLYISVTAQEESYTDIRNDLYLTGLAYLHSKKPLNKIALIQKNMEQNYKLEYLETSFKKDISQYAVDCLNQNYIVPLISLYENYKALGNVEKQKVIKNKITQLAETSEQKKVILEMINK